MAFDSLWLSATIEEIQPVILLSRIIKIQQPDKHTILLRLNNRHNGDTTLLLSAHPQQARMQLTQNNFANPYQPPVFCQILRKYLENGKITAIRQMPWERVTELTIASRNEIGDPIKLYLMVEIMGKHSNLLLVEKNGQQTIILDGIHRYSHAVSRYREVLPGRPYLPPPPQSQVLLDDLQEESFGQLLLTNNFDTPISAALSAKIAGFSPGLAKTVVQNTGLAPQATVDLLGEYELSKLWQELQSLLATKKNKALEPYFLYRNDKLCDYTVWPLKMPLEGEKCQLLENTTVALDTYYQAKNTQNEFAAKAGELLKKVREKKEKTAKKLALQQKELQEAKDGEAYLEKGQLLTAYRYLVKPGMDTVSLPSFYDTDKNIDILLNPDKSPQQNIQFFFHRYNKSKNTEKMLCPQVDANTDELFYLAELEDTLERAESLADLQVIRQELVEEGLIKASGKKGKTPTGEALPPFTYQLSQGFTVLAGRNHKQNDQLTLKIADKEDLWLHTKNIPGSHVIVRNPEKKEIPEEVILQAAAIAAYHSKARFSNQVPVDYTSIKQVKKPSGAKPGMVIYTQNKTVFVKPALPATKE